MKKSVFKIISVVCVLLILGACGISMENETTEYVISTETTQSITFTTDVYQPQQPLPQTEPTTAPSATVVPKTEPSSSLPSTSLTQAPTTPVSVPTPTMPQETPTNSTTVGQTYTKTGEMEFSDSPNNKYIKAIVKKYGVDAETLVAIYTVPDNDGNIVLQFDGTKDSNGKLIRNENTLVSIFTIDRNLVSKCASENRTENEYSTGEKIVIFLSVRNYIMPEFEAELKG